MRGLRWGPGCVGRGGQEWPSQLPERSGGLGGVGVKADSRRGMGTRALGEAEKPKDPASETLYSG